MAVNGHAIIGCGRVAPNHVDGFSRVPGWAVTVACDPGDHVEAFAREHGIPRVTRHVGDVLADDGVRSVSVAVDHASHAPLVEEALRAGKHVLVEKPFGLDPVASRRLSELATSHGLTLSAVSQHRYDPVVVGVRDWLARGLLGELVYVSASLQARREADYYVDSYWRGRLGGEGGSALINQGYHCLDAVRWLCGDLDVQAAAARTVALGSAIETEDTLCGLLTTRHGVPVTLAVTVASSSVWRTRIEVVGTEGTVTFDLDHPGRLHHWSGSAELVTLAEAESRRSLEEEPPGAAYYGVSHRRQIADFCRSVTTGAPMRFDAAESVGTLETVLGLYARATATATATAR